MNKRTHRIISLSIIVILLATTFLTMFFVSAAAVWETALDFNLPISETADSTAEQAKIFSLDKTAVAYIGAPYNTQMIWMDNGKENIDDGSVIFKVKVQDKQFYKIRFTYKGRNLDHEGTYVKYSISADNVTYSSPQNLDHNGSLFAEINVPEMEVGTLATSELYIKFDLHALSWDWAYMTGLKVEALYEKPAPSNELLNFNLPATEGASTAAEEAKIFESSNIKVGYFGAPYSSNILYIDTANGLDGSVTFKMQTDSKKIAKLKFTLVGRNHNDIASMKYSYSKDNISYTPEQILGNNASVPATIDSAQTDVSSLNTTTIYLKLNLHTNGSWDWAYLQQVKVTAEYAEPNGEFNLLAFDLPNTDISSTQEESKIFEKSSTMTVNYQGFASGKILRLNEGQSDGYVIFKISSEYASPIGKIRLVMTGRNLDNAGTYIKYSVSKDNFTGSYTNTVEMPHAGGMTDEFSSSELNIIDLNTTEFYLKLDFHCTSYDWAYINSLMVYGQLFKLPVQTTVNFESTTQPFTAETSSRLTVTHDTNLVLHGQRSLKVEFPETALTTNAVSVTGAINGGSKAFDGIAFRVKTGDSTGKLNLKTIQASGEKAFDISGSVMYDMVGNKINDFSNDGATMSIPANSDGFIFVPILSSSGYVCTDDSILKFVFSEGWASAVMYIDDISYYSGTDYPSIIDTIQISSPLVDPSLHTEALYLKHTFETSETTPSVVVDNTANLTSNVVDDFALSGSKSLQIKALPSISNSTASISFTMPGTGDAVDGLFLRIATEAKDKALLKISVKQGINEISLGSNVSYYRWDRAPIVPAVSSDSNTNSICIPDNLNGYIFVPFSGIFNGTVYTNTLLDFTISFTFNSDWADVNTLIDDIGYYAGAKYNKVLNPFVPVSNVYTGTQTNTIANFENASSPFTAAGQLTQKVSDDKSILINGNKSLEVYLDNGFTSGSLQTDVSAKQGARGLLLRTRFTTPAGLLFKVSVTQGARTYNLGTIKKYKPTYTYYAQDPNTDMASSPYDITNTIDKTNKGISMAKFFDGYIFVSLADSFEGSGFDPSAGFTLKLAFENISEKNTYGNCIIVLDDISVYSGKYLNFADIFRATDPTYPAFVQYVEPSEEINIKPVYNQNSTVLVNFEDGTNPLTAGGSQAAMLETSIPSTEKLNGNKSLKVYATSALSPWAAISGTLPGVNHQYNGIMFRMKMDGSKNSLYRVMPNQQNGLTTSQISYCEGIKLIDLKGNDVTQQNNPLSKAWQGFMTPAYFDGYVFVPFSSKTEGPDLNTANKFTFNLLFINNGPYDAIFPDVTTYLDDIGFYKGSTIDDMKNCIKELDPKIDWTGKSSSTVEMATGAVEAPDIYSPSLTDTALGITVSNFTEGTLPENTVLHAALSDKTQYSTAAQSFGSTHNLPGISVNNAFDLNVSDTKGQLFDLPGLVAVTFKLPANVDPYDIGVCTVDENGTLQYLQTIPVEEENAVKCYTRFLGKMILVSAGVPTTIASPDDTSSQTDSPTQDDTKDIVIPPTESVVDTLDLSSLKSILASATEDSITIVVKQGTVLTTEMQQAIIDSSKKVQFKVNDETGDTLGIWIFGNFTASSGDIDLSFNKETTFEQTIGSLFKSGLRHITISTVYKGSLPQGTIILVKNTANFVKSDLLKLMSFDSLTNKLTDINTKILFTSEGSFIGAAVNNISDDLVIGQYKKTQEKTETPVPDKGTSSNLLIIIFIIIGIAVIITAVIIFVIIRRKNLSNK